jgi:hypothetical protein
MAGGTRVPGGVRPGRGDESHCLLLPESGSAWELIQGSAVNLSEVAQLHKATAWSREAM